MPREATKSKSGLEDKFNGLSNKELKKAPSFLGAFVIERVLFSKWIYRLIVYSRRLLIQKH